MSEKFNYSNSAWDSQDSPRGLLVRSMTIDERAMLSAEARKDNFRPFEPLKKRNTFVDKSRLVSRPSYTINDVIYRRHFGEAPKLKRSNPSLHGMKFQKEEVLVARHEEAVVVVDTFSTGAALANMLYKLGYQVICLLSGELEGLLDMVPEGLDFSFAGTIIYDNSLDTALAFDKVVANINSLKWPVVAVIPGAETGVELADKLSEYLGLRTNGTELTEARRNKYVMGETVRAAGVRAVKQLRAVNWGEIAAFIDDWKPEPFKVIVKPMDSAGSDDVTLCHSLHDVQAAFGNIMGKVNGLGIVNKAVLVQEYLEGQEYVVDMVSRDGEHKVVALWAYDRRPANGADFVNHGQHMLTSDQPNCRELIDYQKKVLDALGIRNGPTHGEVKWCKGEPVLVEVGARCHGGDGLWIGIANEAFGADQASATVQAYLLPEEFAKIPMEPYTCKKFALTKWLVSYKEGIFKGLNPEALAEIKSMESYRGMQVFVDVGTKLKKTQNCFSWTGAVNLVHESETSLWNDYKRLEELQITTLYETEPENVENTGIVEKKYVAVVDPFSTGAVLASVVCKSGFQVIAVYSANLEQLANLAGLVPQGLSLSFSSIVAFDTDVEVMATYLRPEDGPLVAVLAGTETGVELADKLSEYLGLRTNGTTFSEARRNKYVMGETVRAAGVRAVKQLRAVNWGEIAVFIDDWKPEPFKVIVKPMDSAGSDCVTLCHSLEDVQAAFNKIMGKVNGLGLVNKAVLVQEYLEGQEYVVDTVSRDGEHKVVALWAYDRRAANGADFVNYGQRLLTADEPFCRELIDYQKKVLDALGIRNGPTHGEVKWCKGEPVLVEVGARCHGVEGAWQVVVKDVYGYEQIEVTVDSYLNPEAFAAIPLEVLSRHAFGRLLFLQCNVSGTLLEINCTMIEEIRNMSSFIHLELFIRVGQEVHKTIDCFTFAGIIKMVNKDLSTLLRDYDRIREMENSGLFVCM